MREDSLHSQHIRDLRVALVVCGKFHYFNYAPLLERSGVLSQFIFSHRLSAHARLNGSARFWNLFVKEYLFQLHNRLLGDRLGNALNPLYHWQWDHTVAAVLKPCSVLHFLMHGNCQSVLRRAKKFGAACIGEAVNSHPDDYQAQIDREHFDLGLPGRPIRPRFVDRIKDEIPQVDHLLVPSVFVEDSYVRHGVPREKIIRLPYGANLKDFNPGSGGGSVFRVICVGQVTLRKGHQYLLRAWKALNLPSAELHCYGVIDSKIIGRLRGIGAPNVIFHGSVAKAVLVKALQSASVFVLPTVEEGFAVSILEAMACGLPVITTRASGADGVITDGLDGYIVASRSVDLIENRLQTLFDDKRLREEMGRAARELVASRYNWSNYTENLLRIYDGVLAEHRLPSAGVISNSGP